ncbi:MAG: dephospho-CoA kinase [Lachnospiraceae bacterium]|nr:dephospho-CoA kinase [Lachnospiraceae bacterium]
MRVIGITGGVGAGKSKVLEYLEEKYNCQVILADKVAHMLEEKGQKCYEELTVLLGEEILAPDKSIDKQKMAAIIFADRDLLHKVNNIVHPAVKAFIVKTIEDKRTEGRLDFLFIEAALLIEGGYDVIVDELWYIHSDVDVRRDRLKSTRAYSDEKIDEIIQKQLSEEEFRKHCKVIIDNSGSFVTACKQIDEKMEEYLCQR